MANCVVLPIPRGDCAAGENMTELRLVPFGACRVDEEERIYCGGCLMAETYSACFANYTLTRVRVLI